MNTIILGVQIGRFRHEVQISDWLPRSSNVNSVFNLEVVVSTFGGAFKYSLVSRALQVWQLVLHFLISGRASRGSQGRLSSRTVYRGTLLSGYPSLVDIYCVCDISKHTLNSRHPASYLYNEHFTHSQLYTKISLI